MESPCRVTCDTVRQSRSSLRKTDNPMTNENKRDLLLVIVCIPVHLLVTIVPLLLQKPFSFAIHTHRTFIIP